MASAWAALGVALVVLTELQAWPQLPLALAPLNILLPVDDPLQSCKGHGLGVDTLEELAMCMRRYVVRENSIDKEAWLKGDYFPSKKERSDLEKLVRRFATASDAKLCKKVYLPDSLRHVYRPPAYFYDFDQKEGFCVLLERVKRGRFVRGWAWLVVRPGPGVDSPGRAHVGTPHPAFEGPVDTQAIAVFKRTPAAVSAVVSGKHRAATPAPSPCLPAYPASDPSHNAADAYNVISYALLQLEAAGAFDRVNAGATAVNGQPAATATTTGATTADPAAPIHAAGTRPDIPERVDGAVRNSVCQKAIFLQFHGKKEENCANSTIFASGGFGPTAAAFHARNDTALAAVVRQLAVAAPPGITVHTPATDASCILSATRNVFGRAVNGVPRRDVCSTAASEEPQEGTQGGAGACFGRFVHVEQSAAPREQSAWGMWAQVLSAALQEL